MNGCGISCNFCWKYLGTWLWRSCKQSKTDCLLENIMQFMLITNKACKKFGSLSYNRFLDIMSCHPFVLVSSFKEGFTVSIHIYFLPPIGILSSQYLTRPEPILFLASISNVYSWPGMRLVMVPSNSSGPNWRIFVLDEPYKLKIQFVIQLKELRLESYLTFKSMHIIIK